MSEVERIRSSFQIVENRTALLRCLYWRHLRRYDYEICEECGRPVARGIGSYWSAPDDLWAEVTGRRDKGGVFCPRCFDTQATSQGRLIYFEAREWKEPAAVESGFAAPLPLVGDFAEREVRDRVYFALVDLIDEQAFRVPTNAIADALLSDPVLGVALRNLPDPRPFSLARLPRNPGGGLSC